MARQGERVTVTHTKHGDAVVMAHKVDQLKKAGWKVKKADKKEEVATDGES